MIRLTMIFLISFHRSSGIRIIVLLTDFLLVSIIMYDNKKPQAIFLSIFGIGS